MSLLCKMSFSCYDSLEMHSKKMSHVDDLSNRCLDVTMSRFCCQPDQFSWEKPWSINVFLDGLKTEKQNTFYSCFFLGILDGLNTTVYINSKERSNNL